MQTVPLTNSNLVALVDDDDYAKVSTLKWYARKSNCKTLCFYAWATTRVNGRRVFMHQLVFGHAPIGLEIDHIDRNGLNNQKSNLRFADHSTQMFNRPGWRIGLKGVYFQKILKTRPWRAQIRINGKKIDLGCFPSELEAHQAYCLASNARVSSLACPQMPST